MINFNAEVCKDFEKAVSREWLETNGIGGFASSTVTGANTRRYHGLLTAATKPPLGRLVLLSKFEETVFINGKQYDISANQYENAVYPEGFRYLKNFRLAPFPVWTFEIEEIEIEKKIFMPDGENTTVCHWSVKTNGGQITLEVKPLLAFRDYHHLRVEDDDFNGEFETGKNLVSVRPYAEMPKLNFSHNALEVQKTGFWYRNFKYEIEKRRGFDFTEDLFQPFSLKFDLQQQATVIASTEVRKFSDAEKLEKAEIRRREHLIDRANAKDDFTKQLVLAADRFIVSRGGGKTVIAGYHWFSDWGRDTMIALSGLTLATNRPEIAKSILLEFSEHISEGMLPNRFPDAGDEAEYNTVDATLWFFEAIRAYAEKTEDYEFIAENLYEKLADIIEWHLLGTRYEIHADDDGLLFSGGQLTWMDAKIGDYVVTPRRGKAVEIQALWYNALMIMADFAERFGDEKQRGKYRQTADKTKRSFNDLFWNDTEECLFDVISGEEKDSSIRPNQIFAVSLKNAILTDAEKARKVVEKVEAELLTSVGLRSLSPKDSRYCPIYIGSPFERDSAYHQGTVWAWLIGGFVDAYRKVNAGRNVTEHRINEILEGFKSHITEAGVGQISEIFDADPPHTPRGCIAQAWSIAEILRVLNDNISVRY